MNASVDLILREIKRSDTEKMRYKKDIMVQFITEKFIRRAYIMRTKNEIEQQLKEIHSIELKSVIHSATGIIGGIAAGLAQAPSSDTVFITPIQISMITAIGLIYDIRIGEAAAKSILSSFGTAVLGRTISQWLIGWCPGGGNVFNATTAIALTEALGWHASTHFAGKKAEGIYKNEKLLKDLEEKFNEKINKCKVEFKSAYDKHVNDEAEYNILLRSVMDKYQRVRLTITDEENTKILDLIKNSLEKNIGELKDQTFSKESPSFMSLKSLDKLLTDYLENPHIKKCDGYLENKHINNLEEINNNLVSSNKHFLSILNNYVSLYIK